MASARTWRIASGPTGRLAAVVGGTLALVHCLAMGVMGWFVPLGFAVDVPGLRPLQTGLLGHAFSLEALTLLTVGLHGRSWRVQGVVAATSLWRYRSMYPLYVAWLQSMSVVLWTAVVLAAYRVVHARSAGTAGT